MGDSNPDCFAFPVVAHPDAAIGVNLRNSLIWVLGRLTSALLTLLLFANRAFRPYLYIGPWGIQRRRQGEQARAM